MNDPLRNGGWLPEPCGVAVPGWACETLGAPARGEAEGTVILRAFGGTVLYLLLVAIIGLGVALLVRETAWATVVVLSMLYVIPVRTQFISDPSWERLLQRLSPSAGLAIQHTVASADLPLTPWAGLAVTSAYAAVLAAAGALSFIHRDP